MTEIRVVCKCPACYRIYRQAVKGGWTGATRKVRSGQIALRTLCASAGQGPQGGEWYGHAYCSECCERRLPPSLRGPVGDWLRHGEEL
jgi:hypothetical protein